MNTIKTIIIATVGAVFLLPLSTRGQRPADYSACIPEMLPTNLSLSERQPVRYRMTALYRNDDIAGHFFGDTRVSGLYTRALPGGGAQWNEVFVANVSRKDAPFPEAVKQVYMENLRYNPKTVMSDSVVRKKMVSGTLFTKNLIWDMVTFEGFAWTYFDSLRLNIPFHARTFNGDVSLDGAGVFSNHDVLLTWSGISVMNGRKCALIQFEAMDNPLELDINGMKAKGRSHYWGNIWVCLDDEQIEGGWLNEDVVLDMILAGNGKTTINTVRRITLEKLK